jgi:imidazolonepropionase-like amidohydrolase
VTRTLLRGGRVFDGTGAPPAEADVLVEDGRILDVGPGLDGDEAVDVGGRYLLPGLFDCHTHVTISNVNLLGMLQTPFSYRFFETVRNLAATLRVGITTVRDAAGADAGVTSRTPPGARRSRSPRPTPTPSAGPWPPGSRWPWGPTAASPPTAATWPSWS